MAVQSTDFRALQSYVQLQQHTKPSVDPAQVLRALDGAEHIGAAPDEQWLGSITQQLASDGPAFKAALREAWQLAHETKTPFADLQKRALHATLRSMVAVETADQPQANFTARAKVTDPDSQLEVLQDVLTKTFSPAVTEKLWREISSAIRQNRRPSMEVIRDAAARAVLDAARRTDPRITAQMLQANHASDTPERDAQRGARELVRHTAKTLESGCAGLVQEAFARLDPHALSARRITNSVLNTFHGALEGAAEHLVWGPGKVQAAKTGFSNYRPFLDSELAPWGREVHDRLTDGSEITPRERELGQHVLQLSDPTMGIEVEAHEGGALKFYLTRRTNGEDVRACDVPLQIGTHDSLHSISTQGGFGTVDVQLPSGRKLRNSYAGGDDDPHHGYNELEEELIFASQRPIGKGAHDWQAILRSPAPGEVATIEQRFAASIGLPSSYRIELDRQILDSRVDSKGGFSGKLFVTQRLPKSGGGFEAREVESIRVRGNLDKGTIEAEPLTSEQKANITYARGKQYQSDSYSRWIRARDEAPENPIQQDLRQLLCLPNPNAFVRFESRKIGYSTDTYMVPMLRTESGDIAYPGRKAVKAGNYPASPYGSSQEGPKLSLAVTQDALTRLGAGPNPLLSTEVYTPADAQLVEGAATNHRELVVALGDHVEALDAARGTDREPAVRKELNRTMAALLQLPDEQVALVERGVVEFFPAGHANDKRLKTHRSPWGVSFLTHGQGGFGTGEDLELLGIKNVNLSLTDIAEPYSVTFRLRPSDDPLVPAGGGLYRYKTISIPQMAERVRSLIATTMSNEAVLNAMVWPDGFELDPKYQEVFDTLGRKNLCADVSEGQPIKAYKQLEGLRRASDDREECRRLTELYLEFVTGVDAERLQGPHNGIQWTLYEVLEGTHRREFDASRRGNADRDWWTGGGVAGVAKAVAEHGSLEAALEVLKDSSRFSEQELAAVKAADLDGDPVFQRYVATLS